MVILSTYSYTQFNFNFFNSVGIIHTFLFYKVNNYFVIYIQLVKKKKEFFAYMHRRGGMG